MLFSSKPSISESEEISLGLLQLPIENSMNDESLSCQNATCRQSLGMYFDCFNQRGRFREIMDNWFSHSVQIIVVTDGGRILGLGDLGETLPNLPKLPNVCISPRRQ